MQVLKESLEVSSFMHTNGTARHLLNIAQRKEYGTVKAIATHCSTRFATVHLVAKSVLESDAALRAITVTPAYSSLESSSQPAKDIKGCIACKCNALCQDMHVNQHIQA
jgi:hypothetical protein